jgi:hypothetical protein
MKRIIKKIIGWIGGGVAAVAMIMPTAGYGIVVFLTSLAVAVVFFGIWAIIEYTET